MFKDRDEFSGEVYKDIKFIIKKVVFKIFNLILLFFIVIWF